VWSLSFSNLSLHTYWPMCELGDASSSWFRRRCGHCRSRIRLFLHTGPCLELGDASSSWFRRRCGHCPSRIRFFLHTGPCLELGDASSSWVRRRCGHCRSRIRLFIHTPQGFTNYILAILTLQQRKTSYSSIRVESSSPTHLLCRHGASKRKSAAMAPRQEKSAAAEKASKRQSDWLANYKDHTSVHNHYHGDRRTKTKHKSKGLPTLQHLATTILMRT